MAKAVFTSKVSPSYDDLPEERYHFPSTYLNAVRAALDDWIVYYEPRRVSPDLSSSGGRQSYFATARVVEVTADPHLSGHWYAHVRDYLEFDNPVPFREGSLYYEANLQKADGSTNKGRFGRAVRVMKDTEYAMIVAAGFEAIAQPLVHEGVRGKPWPWTLSDRPIIHQVTRRPFRDQAFTTGVRRIYDNTCAMSGVRILNGGGRPEAQAAHIRPVAANGPDSLRNGLALSSTFHWMFDRGLISVDDDYRLLLKRGSVPDDMLSLVNRSRRLRLPEQQVHHPHPRFLQYHREHVFKG